jgi:hypothetical protein
MEQECARGKDCDHAPNTLIHVSNAHKCAAESDSDSPGQGRNLSLDFFSNNPRNIHANLDDRAETAFAFAEGR